MADFRQLALEFVLADDEKVLANIASTAATELENGPAGTNPVARWVEAVQPWMPGSEAGDDDATARAKALEFLSRTLGYLGQDVLTASQLKLLVKFFGAMFEVDHKAGILASSTALSRIVDMKSFQAQSGNDIIQQVCALKDDFPRQVSGTRLTVYTMLRKLLSHPDVAKDLQRRHGEASTFMRDLVQLCRSERDPDCLMVWFDTLRIFLVRYPASEEALEEVYGCFKSYFPITLPRTSQSGVTPEELKLQLRHCFSSSSLLAKHVFPFLLGKVDQGDAITVNVKLDIFRTMKACIDNYANAEQSIYPYVNQIWGSLKYEVRNGEIEDTIWATLEVLKSLTVRLSGDALRDYTMNVSRECVNDFSNATFTASSGRLLVGILSASTNAFTLMVSPTITHIKDNLRHRKSPSHSRDLLKILHVVLETRLLLSETNMTEQEVKDFVAVDVAFKSLYEDVYKGPVGLGSKDNLSDEDMKIATQAVQGAGALICQRAARSTVVLDAPGDSRPPLLLPNQTCSDICDALFSIISHSTTETSRGDISDELVNETSKSLQRAAMAYGQCYQPLVDKAMKLIRSQWTEKGADAASTVQDLCFLLAFLGCSEIHKKPASGLDHFLYFVQSMMSELFASIAAGAHPRIWCAIVAGLQTAVRYLNDACLVRDPYKETPFQGQWPYNIIDKYPVLAQLEGMEATVPTGTDDSSPVGTASVGDVRNEALLIGLFVVKQLYRRALTIGPDTGSNGKTLMLREDTAKSDSAARLRYLHLIATFAGFICHEMSESQQHYIRAENFAINLFYEEHIAVPQRSNDSNDMQGVESASSDWAWLLTSELNALSLGILEVLRPQAVARLFDAGVAQEIISTAISSTFTSSDPATASINRAILTVLSNRFKVESLEALISDIEQHAASSLKAISTSDSSAISQVTSLFAIANGMIRRGDGRRAPNILQLLREAPSQHATGYRLARRLEMVVAPQSFLSKENYAVVKPLWMQKAYMELVKPMLAVATGADAARQEPLVKTSHAIGVLSLVKHMDFSIFEEDVDEIIRISIMTAQNLGIGPDTEAALEVLKKTLSDASEKAQSHLRSLVNVCIQSFSTRVSSSQRPEWVPEDYEGGQSSVACGKLALEILGAMPSLFEAPQLLPFAAVVSKELTVGCGYHVRELRKLARLARAAWAGLKA
ncbi:Dos2-interacting transcription regulator of RNA-Pol-II-domain-containing protein [Stachybotrys elegans]|uniref:MMS19 nucleotide excision repair protein n=1 Tax=Stachybotrys elegans TaxID=80388 RepID=A0A8K0WWC3_9HYPO|nr:Dos2-interacting transcription regulator of RNA-Pol-II-domain-containing protein [Stachybotrys elegans]